ncbi:NAD(P)-dependent oxidoreductase [Denitratisoma oestradiolicum]|uniref:2-hydroxy-3-oxopropionate reductase n=1 Tax=Denitratisoma oestradiolicum TaxID=311182 RepID=A0A6S6XY89_9PROT|nr:NAD(P)-dependent oxidoreductase [Denitratisoma oestradiolicum]TWO81136.1 2-hydroxy-3-oxopropionate reductase [Denitratisoma oestradiolicum]CAB1367822.1 2-hydroxy-3-oxopropionate reductase [Denitratisoma oestradiolicum]
MNIGFIGLGLMGKPMALHLARAGHALHVWARRAETLAPFRADADVMIHDSPSALAARAEVVITMVADAPDVVEVLFGTGGVVEGAAPGSLVVDMSTIAPAAARGIAARLAGHDLSFLDAPVSGGERGAIEASLTVMAGGPAEVFARAEPLLRLLGRSVIHVGEVGAGQVAKACNQILTGVTVMAVAEALNFARCSGVDPCRVREALLGGFAYSRILENHGQRMLDRNFQPGFKAWMHQKDMGIVMDEAHRLGLPLPTAAATAQVFNALVGSGLGEEDSVAVLKLLEAFGGGRPVIP